MANSTFSGPVRSENGFLEKDEAGNWVPVSGGGGGGGGGEPLAVLLKIQTFRFDAVPALPIIGSYYEYDGTESSTVTVKPSGVVPGTYSNPVVSIQYETGFITAAAEGVAPSPGPSTAPVVGYASVSTVLNGSNGTVVLDPDGLPSGAMVTGIYVRLGSGVNPSGNDIEFNFSTDSNTIVDTYNTYYPNTQASLLADPNVWGGSFLPLASGSSSTNLRVFWYPLDPFTNVPCQFTVQYVVFP